jgi:excisionase family DNA binding protein
MSTYTEADPVHSTPDFLRRSISPREFARRVGVSPTTVHKWIEGGLPSGLVGNRRLIHIDTADAWLRAKLGVKPDVTQGDSQ